MGGKWEIAISFKLYWNKLGDFMKKKGNSTELLLIIPAISLLAIWILYIIFEK